jgi:hypothetical protein
VLFDQRDPLLTDTIDGVPTVNVPGMVTLTQPILLLPPLLDDVFVIVRRTLSDDPATIAVGLAEIVQLAPVSAAATLWAWDRRAAIAPTSASTR